MTSATYLVEVRDDGMIAIGHLDHVTRTLILEYVDGRPPETWISLRGRVLTAEARLDDEARVLALSAMLQTATT